MDWRQMLFVMEHPSQVGPRLVRRLAELARGCDADLELYQPAFEWGMHKGGIGSIASDIETRETLDRRDSELDRVIEALRAAGVRVRGAVSCEKPTCQNILKHVLESQPDLVIVQSRSHSSIARLMLTYTDFKLIEQCPCPLLLMKTEKAYLDASILAAVDPMHIHQRPPLLDEAIIGAATAMSEAVGGTLHICHALAPWEGPTIPGDSEPLSGPTYAELSLAYRERAQSRVDDLARRANIREGHVHVTWGDPAEVIPKLARSLFASVVVMGAVSRSALDRVVIGHTAERVLDALDCDVLVVKPPGFQS
jgi:universal stress protein E